MKAVRIAVVGTNFISDWFCDSAVKCEGVTLAAVCSRAEESANAFADRHGIPLRFSDYGAMLASDEIDAVYLATPNYLHDTMTMAALAAGKHVLCEKPAAQTATAFRAMRATAEKHGKVLLEAMRPAHDPALAALVGALPKIGALRRVALEYCQYSSRYDKFRAGEILRAFDPSIGNCALHDIGIYPLAVAAQILGEPKRVTAHSVFLSNGFEGAGEALLDYSDRGFFATVAYSKISESVRPSVFEGEDGSLTIDKISAPTKVVLHRRGEPEKIVWQTDGENNMRYEIVNFASMVNGELSPAPFLDVTELALTLADRILPFNTYRKE